MEVFTVKSKKYIVLIYTYIGTYQSIQTAKVILIMSDFTLTI